MSKRNNRMENVSEGKRKVFSCIMVTLAAFTQGTMFLWNSFSLPNIEKQGFTELNNKVQEYNLTVKKSEENLSEQHLSLIASAHSIGAALGAIGSGSVLCLGPINIVLPLLSCVVVLSWVLMVYASSLPMMVAGKLLLGLSLTLQCSQVPLYIAQVAPTKHRGLLLSLFSIIRNLSQIIVTASAELLPISWRMLTCLFGVVPAGILAVAGPGLSTVEEVDSNKKKDLDSIAYGIMNATSFASLLNSTLITKKDPKLGNCIKFVPDSVDNVAEMSKLPQKKLELEKYYGSAKVSTAKQKIWSIIKSTLFLMLFASSYILSGMVLITNFPSKLFTPTYPYTPLLAISLSLLSNLVGSIISTFLTNKCGLRMVLMVSSAMMAICMSSLSIFYYLDMLCTTDHSYMCYFPLLIIIIFFLFLSIGVGTIFIVILGEKLPLKKRSLTITVIMVTMEVLDAAQCFILPILLSYLDKSGLTVVFGGHAVANLASVVVAFFWIG